MIPITDINPRTNATWRWYHGLRDSGADDTVFLEDTPRLLGIELTIAVVGLAGGTTGLPLQLSYAAVAIQLSDRPGNAIEWRTLVAFAPKTASFPLLGLAGFLPYFDVTLFAELEEVE